MITPEEFKSISYEIEEKLSETEASLRTAIGRKYYYIYLELRETIKVFVSREQRQILNEDSPTKESLHCILREVLFIISKRETLIDIKKAFKKAAISFKNLRNRRNESDYKIKSTIEKNILENLESSLKDIENILPKISQIGRERLSSYLEEAIEICKKNRQRNT